MLDCAASDLPSSSLQFCSQGAPPENNRQRINQQWRNQRRCNKLESPRAPGAKTIEETRPAISEALGLLNDNHSFYQPKSGSVIAHTRCTSVPASTAPISVPVVPSTIGYVRVTGFMGTAAEAAAFAHSIQETIKVYDSQGVTGWLVDLRQNVGGNMWPMITGLSPILGDGPLGYFIVPQGAKMAWGLRDGVAYLDEQAKDQNKATFRLQNEAPRVAVLTDALTASSGEAVAIAFRGRADTRSFGTPTCGLSTANHTYPLSDGGFLYLTTSVMADREGTPYGGPVVPDEVVEDSAKVAERAIAWLQAGAGE